MEISIFKKLKKISIMFDRPYIFKTIEKQFMHAKI